MWSNELSENTNLCMTNYIPTTFITKNTQKKNVSYVI